MDSYMYELYGATGYEYVWNIVLTGVFALLAAGFGIWLSRRGRPLNVAIKIIHYAFAGLAFLISLFMYMDLTGYNRREPAILVLDIASTAVFAVLVLTGFAMNENSRNSRRLRLVHAAAAIAILLLTAGVAIAAGALDIRLYHI